MWQKLTIESKNSIEEYTKNRFEICDLSFSNLLLWSIGENTEYEIENDVLTMRSVYMGEVYYYMPIPKNDTPENIEKMKEKIREILVDIRPEYDFAGDENFVESVMLDSFDVLTLVTDLEEKFGVKIDGGDILPENFGSIEAIENLIVKSGAKA